MLRSHKQTTMSIKCIFIINEGEKTDSSLQFSVSTYSNNKPDQLYVSDKDYFELEKKNATRTTAMNRISIIRRIARHVNIIAGA